MRGGSNVIRRCKENNDLERDAIAGTSGRERRREDEEEEEEEEEILVVVMLITNEAEEDEYAEQRSRDDDVGNECNKEQDSVCRRL